MGNTATKALANCVSCGTKEVQILMLGLDGGLIFLINGCDKEKLKKEKHELDSLIIDLELSNVNLLVMANKHDLLMAMNSIYMTIRLGLENLGATKKWHVQSYSGKIREGLHDALDWLASTIN